MGPRKRGAGECERTTMTSNKKNRFKLIRMSQESRQLLRILPQRLLLTQELGRDGIVLKCFDGRGIEWGLTTIRGCDYNLDMVC